MIVHEYKQLNGLLQR